MSKIFSLITFAFVFFMVAVGITDWAMGGTELLAFVLSAVISLIIGLCFWLMHLRGLIADKVFYVVGGSWSLGTLIAALPFLLMSTELGWVDAFFEAASGITTTGATVLNGLERLSPGILLWRAVLQMIGGAGLMIGIIALFPLLRNLNIHKLVLAESLVLKNNTFSTQARGVKMVIIAYLGSIVLCGCFYYVFGMSGFDSVCHAMATVSTGGFANYDVSFAHYTDPKLLVTAIIFMVIGSLPFLTLVSWTLDVQLKWFFLLLTIFTVAIMIVLRVNQIPLEPLRSDLSGAAGGWLQVVFTVVSIMTTTGFAVVDYSNWNNALVLMFMAMMIGGCSGSTAGGIKIFRVIYLFKAINNSLIHIVKPHRVLSSDEVELGISEDVTTRFALYTICFCLASAWCSCAGMDAISAVSASAAAIANFGPGFGAEVGPASDYSNISMAAKVMLSLSMLAGRLEVVSLLLFFVSLFRKD